MPKVEKIDSYPSYQIRDTTDGAFIQFNETWETRGKVFYTTPYRITKFDFLMGTICTRQLNDRFGNKFVLEKIC